MRISRTGSSRPTKGASPIKGKDSAEFAKKFSSVESGEATESAQAAGGLGGVSGVGAVDAIMALQSADSEPERRERALRKGRRLLDALDKLQLSALDGATTSAHLGLLKRALEHEREASGDDGLDDALKHIEVRAAVEIAKLERIQIQKLGSSR